MPTLTYADGFEHRTVSINDYTQTDGQGIVDAITGVPTIDTTTPRTGACCLEVAPAGAAVRVEKNMPGTNPAVCTAGFAIRFVTSLPAADARMAQFVPAAGTAARLLFHQATSKLNLAFSTGALGTDFGPVLVANTWYWVDLRLDVSGATATLDGQVDAGTNLQITLVEAASTISNMRFGTDTTNTYTARFDDWMFSYTAVDYPLGPAKVLPLYVSGDGAHNTGTAGNFTDFGSVNITDTTTNAYTHLDDWTAGVTDTTTGVIDVAGASTNYTEHTFDDTTENTIWAVMGASACYPSSTTAHVLTIRLVDSGGTTVQEILPTANFDISNVANQLEYTNRLMSTNVSQGTVNGYKVRVGLSTDVSPAPKCTAVMLQIAAPVTAAGASLMAQPPARRMRISL